MIKTIKTDFHLTILVKGYYAKSDLELNQNQFVSKINKNLK